MRRRPSPRPIAIHRIKDAPLGNARRLVRPHSRRWPMASASTSAPESVWFLDGLMYIHVSAGNGGHDISLIEHTAPYLSSPPVHAHRDEDEIFYLLDGEVRFVVEGRPATAGAGQSVVAPR